MKKAGAHLKFNDETQVLIIILAIVVAFIFLLKPIYQFASKVKSGTLFEKSANKKLEKEEEILKDNYEILTPEGASKVVCTRTSSTKDGDKNEKVVLYYTTNKVRSITNDITLSASTDDYINYIYSVRQEISSKKNANLSNKGYSVKYELNGSRLTISEVYKLSISTIEKVGTEYEITEDIQGEYDDDIDELMRVYISRDYECEGE